MRIAVGQHVWLAEIRPGNEEGWDPGPRQRATVMAIGDDDEPVELGSNTMVVVCVEPADRLSRDRDGLTEFSLDQTGTIERDQSW